MARASTFLALGLVICGCGHPQAELAEPTFDGNSESLQATRIVATLDAPLEAGQSTIWCASFPMGWKAVEAYAGAALELEDAPPVVEALNAAGNSRDDVPDDSLFVEVGPVKENVLTRIETGLKKRFPQAPQPVFPPLNENSLVAYAYLMANVPFPIPYSQNQYPLEFTDSEGRVTNVRSLGIASDDDPQLRLQPRVLFKTDSAEETDFEFAIDLCRTSEPSQIIVAHIKQEATLQAAVDRVAREQNAYTGPADVQVIDVVAVPDMCWKIVHRFAELEGKHILNSRLRGQSLDLARQGIAFRLDRRGAELESSTTVTFTSIEVPSRFVCDRPYLILMQKRGSRRPYFAMWVENAELLTAWD